MTDTRDRREAPEAAEGLPVAYWRILPLHVLSEVYGLEGLRHRLVLEIEQFPTDQQEILHRALALAERLHAHDRRSREPYMHHILRVTIRIASRDRVRDLDALVAALLHDAVEDHAAELAGGASLNPADDALDVIGRDFGARAAGIVASVTNPSLRPRPRPRRAVPAARNRRPDRQPAGKDSQALGLHRQRRRHSPLQTREGPTIGSKVRAPRARTPEASRDG